MSSAGTGDDDVRTLGSREVYRNAWMSVREDAVLQPDGREGTYGVVDKPDFTLVVPADGDGFWLVEQYRYPVARRSWEFPQGTWGRGSAGSPEQLARAELAEETALRAGRLRHLAHLHAAPGLASQGFDVWLATGLAQGEVAREPTEQDMVSRWVSELELRRMVREGDVVDGATLAAYAVLLLDRTAPR